MMVWENIQIEIFRKEMKRPYTRVSKSTINATIKSLSTTSVMIKLL